MSLPQTDKMHRIIAKLQELQQKKPCLLIAIDGRCAAGKTTLAAHIKTKFDCNVIHMDHFFLRREQRTKERLSEPGGNVDYERFICEVFNPLQHGESFSYKPYDCSLQTLSEAINVTPMPITIIEGSYSCHPLLWDKYDFRIFLTIAPEEQLRRIQLRNPQRVNDFQQRWIPFEEEYFAAYDIQNRCDAVYSLSSDEFQSQLHLK